MKFKPVALSLVASVLLIGCGRSMKQKTLDSFRSQWSQVESNYNIGETNLARGQYDDLWRDIPKVSRITQTHDPFGSITDADVNALKERYSWEKLVAERDSMRASDRAWENGRWIYRRH